MGLAKCRMADGIGASDDPSTAVAPFLMGILNDGFEQTHRAILRRGRDDGTAHSGDAAKHRRREPYWPTNPRASGFSNDAGADATEISREPSFRGSNSRDI